MVKKLDGTLTEFPVEADARWQEHYAAVFGGDIVPAQAVRESTRPPSVMPVALDVGPVATEIAIRTLANNKGVGLDQIPAELLKAGGGATA